jgi:hypothetical protein
MTVERGADVSARPHGSEDLLHDRLIRLRALTLRRVVAPQRTRIRVQPRHPVLAERIGHEMKDLVGNLECGARLGCQVDAERDPGSDDCERSIRHDERRR